MAQASPSQLALLKGERGLVAGRSGSGKSTLAYPALVNGFLRRYANSIAMITDTKPRFRADVDLHGISASRHYRGMDHGVPVIPDSVRLDLMAWPDFGIKAAMQLGHRVLIAQTNGYDNENMLAAFAIDRFYKHARFNRPALVYVDELLDFYNLNGTPKRGMPNSILRCVRAGREKGLATLLATQRTKGIPIQVSSELSKVYLGALDVEDDVEHLQSNGAVPLDFEPPTDDKVFRFYDKLRRNQLLFTLTKESVERALTPPKRSA
jgi:energy-coupling factor transporter ATP-binding protein EcfA2